MKRREALTLGDAIKAYLKASKMDTKLNEVKILNHWEEVVGKIISRSTNNIYIYNKVLFVYLNSSVIRNELQMVKTELIKRLNAKVGATVINDIVLK